MLWGRRSHPTALVFILSSCGGGNSSHVDAPDFGQPCTPTMPTFGSLSGRAAVQGTLNVHVDAGGLIKVDTTSDLLLSLDLVQTDTQVSVSATVCKIQIPDIPLSGQDMPIQFSIPAATIASVGTVTGVATLSSADQTCTDLVSDPLTLVLGAKLDPGSIATAPLPAADDKGMFTACLQTEATACADATGTNCACDQEPDSDVEHNILRPGATLIAHNVPAITLDQVYATIRTTFSLHGQVWSTDLIKGTVDATLETGILACRLTDGEACSVDNIQLMKTLNPVVTPQPSNPSTFTAVRVDPTTTCDQIVANEATLFSQ